MAATVDHTNPAAPALLVRGLEKRFGERVALEGVSFELPVNARLAIFGPNGAGKTTLLSILSSLARPTRGSVQVLGIDALEEPEKVRPHLGVISHAPLLYADLSAQENLEFFARLYGLRNPGERIAYLLDLVELSHRRHDAVRGFSRGMTQRLSIARALLHDPELVFLDEPYSGLDVRAVQIFDGLLSRVCADKTQVIVSHDMEKGFEMCTHALVLAQGKARAFFEKGADSFEEFAAVCFDVLGVEVGRS